VDILHATKKEKEKRKERKEKEKERKEKEKRKKRERKEKTKKIRRENLKEMGCCFLVVESYSPSAFLEFL